MSLIQQERASAHGHRRVCLAVDAMGGDAGPEAVLDGAAAALSDGLDVDLTLVGPHDLLTPLIAARPALAAARIIDAPDVVKMDDKPAHILRRGRETSMWHALSALCDGKADAVVSGGNTGALMALSRHRLRMIKGVDRPAITALWPTPRGRSVVLDVGANVEAEALQLLQFAVMGDAFFRALSGEAHPSVGLLNVGAEELKGHEVIREAAKLLRAHVPDMRFSGFVEGNDISKGTVDVVVTDGFSGNIALKSAEGAARLVGGWMKEAVTDSWLSKLGGLFMRPQLQALKTRIDPSSVNGGVFLGINGVVVKSHGGADAAGVASALRIAGNLARRAFIDDVAERVAGVTAAIATASELGDQGQDGPALSGGAAPPQASNASTGPDHQSDARPKTKATA
ncbi:MAG: phosphate acyltransferase PlsX [Pseudomonadota bacterium]